ncbi:MAG: queuosine precursor transporter, partial [Planctomycetota bacterium]
AQLLDIQLFHFWKRLTKGKHLWLRNNGSTIVSQMVDSTLVVVVLFYDRWTTGEIVSTILDLWFFKVLCALLDTPIIYLIVGFTRDRFPVHQEEPS